MDLYLNKPLKEGQILVLTDPVSIFRQRPETKTRFFPDKPVTVSEKEGAEWLEQKKGHLSDRPYDGPWPEVKEAVQKPGLTPRRIRAGQMRDPSKSGARMKRTRAGQKREEIKKPVEAVIGLPDGLSERKDQPSDEKKLATLQSLAGVNFQKLQPMQLGKHIKGLGLRFHEGLFLERKQELLEQACEYVADKIGEPENV
jgi:hypothetical protein